MHTLVDATPLAAADRQAVIDLAGAIEAVVGYRPLSDQAWADLTQPAAGEVRQTRTFDDHGALIGFAQAVADGGRWTIEAMIAASLADPHEALSATMSALAGAIGDASGSSVVWVVFDPKRMHEAVAGELGLSATRRILQMRRALPIDDPVQIETRSFDPQRDIEPWVEVNHRAFEWNPEQGGWTADTLRSRMSESWFDPDGFLIHERDGRMAGFCWTKVHPGDPPMGEIYVIAVDPDFHGLGLGRALTSAGLNSLAARGLTLGMLFVDGDNTAAVTLYERLGFVTSRTDVLFEGALPR